MFFRFSWKWNKFGVFNGVSKEKKIKMANFLEFPSRVPHTTTTTTIITTITHPPANKQTNKQTQTHKRKMN